jgi:hypothetical protein
MCPGSLQLGASDVIDRYALIVSFLITVCLRDVMSLYYAWLSENNEDNSNSDTRCYSESLFLLMKFFSHIFFASVYNPIPRIVIRVLPASAVHLEKGLDPSIACIFC